MNKTRNNELIKLADEKLKASDTLFLNKEKGEIAESYDGKAAALSVSVAMSDLLPTLAIYYQDYDSKKPCRRYVLDVVATMITKPDEPSKFKDAEDLLRCAIEHSEHIKYLKNEVIGCSIALKQVIRTYNLV